MLRDLKFPKCFLVARKALKRNLQHSQANSCVKKVQKIVRYFRLKVAQYGFHVLSARVDTQYSKCKNLLLITLTPFKSN